MDPKNARKIVRSLYLSVNRATRAAEIIWKTETSSRWREFKKIKQYQAILTSESILPLPVAISRNDVLLHDNFISAAEIKLLCNKTAFFEIPTGSNGGQRSKWYEKIVCF